MTAEAAHSWADTGNEVFLLIGVGSPEQVIERTLGFRDYADDYQRQLFLIDHAGLPLKTVLEQLDLLGEEVVPVLRKEFGTGRPTDVPGAPTHESMLAARNATPGGLASSSMSASVLGSEEAGR